VLVTQMDVFNRLLDTTPIDLAQFGWALVPALVLFVLWELGKLVARHLRAPTAATLGPPPAGAGPALPVPRTEAAIPVTPARS
jgi:Ca2+-transporting ATPase